MISEQDCIECGVCCHLSDRATSDSYRIHDSSARTFQFFTDASGLCTHYHKGQGCEIYIKRPSICKDFEKDGENCLRLRKKSNL